jgi:hypothetical protein
MDGKHWERSVCQAGLVEPPQQRVCPIQFINLSPYDKIRQDQQTNHFSFR